MDTNNEILDAIEILADKKIGENITKILTGICTSVNINKNTCVMNSNGVISTVQFYGSPPEVNELYRIFVPSNNMSRSFVVVPPRFTVNPNLLDNWYFANPVNQRGQTEYTISWNKYSVDRWSCEGDAVYVRIEQDGIVIKNNGSSTIQFKQILPDGLIPVGSAVTISALCTSVSGICHITYAQVGDPYSPSIQWTQIVAGVVTTAHGVQIGGQHKFFIGLGPGAEIKILAAKLEIGSTQTLAHREGDRWVLNEVPEYGEQLRRCQRYCFVWGYSAKQTSCLAVMQAYEPERLFGLIPTPVTMRATPVVTGGSLTTFGGMVTSLWNFNLCANGIRAVAFVNGAKFVVGQAVGIENADDNGRVIFSADL